MPSAKKTSSQSKSGKSAAASKRDESVREFSEGRLWFTLDDKIVTVGVTPSGLDEIGGLESIDLPAEGDVGGQGDRMAMIEGSRDSLEVTAPATGTIAESNTRLITELDILAEDPFEEGWIIKIEIEDPSELNEWNEEDDDSARRRASESDSDDDSEDSSEDE